MLSARLKKLLKSWKPIHLCWWFRRHGLSIPPYLIGGVTSIDQTHWIIGDDDNADPDLCSWDTEDTVRANQDKEADFMLRFQADETGGGSLNNANWQLWYNTADNIDAASQVLTSGSIVKISNTGTPTDQTATTENVCTAAPSGDWQDGLYTDNADESGKKTLNPHAWTEFQFCIQFTSSAGDGTDYFFWLFADDVKLNGTYNSPTCKVTTTAAAGLSINVNECSPVEDKLHQ